MFKYDMKPEYIVVDVDDVAAFHKILESIKEELKFSVIEDEQNPLGKQVLLIFKNLGYYSYIDEGLPHCESIVTDHIYDESISATKLWDLCKDTFGVNEEKIEDCRIWLEVLKELGITIKERDDEIHNLQLLKEYERWQKCYARDQNFERLIKDQRVTDEEEIKEFKHMVGIEKKDGCYRFGEYCIIKCPVCGRYTLDESICICGFEAECEGFGIERAYMEHVLGDGHYYITKQLLDNTVVKIQDIEGSKEEADEAFGKTVEKLSYEYCVAKTLTYWPVLRLYDYYNNCIKVQDCPINYWDDEFPLSNFISCHHAYFNSALAGIKNGHKINHWMWDIFPLIEPLSEEWGYDYEAGIFAIENLDVVKAYLADEYLANNMQKICEALLACESDDPTEATGYPDGRILQSSITLFAVADPENPIFKQVLDKFYHGEMDEQTIEKIR